MSKDVSESRDYLEYWFQPMRFKLKLITNSLKIARTVSRVFAPFGEVSDRQYPDFTFCLFQHSLDDKTLNLPVYKEEGHLLYQSSGRDSTLVVDRRARLAFGYFSPTVLAQSAFFRVHFVELAFYSMLAQQNIMGVHGAAAVKNGRAILFRAPSGGGKTTLAYACARSRFKALAEDVVWLDFKANVWRGLPWQFHLLPDAKTLFPELKDYQPIVQTNRELKLEIPLEKIRPGNVSVCAQPGPVVLVERLPGGKSKLETLSLAQAKPLWLNGVAGSETTFPDYWQRIDKLLANNCYRLYFGDDIEAAINLLEPLFEQASNN